MSYYIEELKNDLEELRRQKEEERRQKEEERRQKEILLIVLKKAGLPSPLDTE